MKAMVFAAGRGTRLRPFTDAHPKALAEIGGVTLLEIVLGRLKDAGVTEVVINLHHFGEQIEAFLEMGVAGVAVIVLLAIAYASRWPVVASRRHSRGLGFLQVAAGLGLLAMAIHGAFDFNFHIPANAVYFAFLAGVFFYDPRE